MLTPEQKKKAKRKLYELSDEGERADIVMREMEEMHDKLSLGMSEGATKKEINALLESLARDMEKMRLSYLKGISTFSDTFKEQHGSFLKSITDMTETLKKQSIAEKINANAGPVYKTMINHLSGMETAFKQWKYPQYASVSVRDSSFSNINPSIAGFNITSPYDTVNITYAGSNPTIVVYVSNGKTVATLTLSYSGSNVTSVVRT